MTAADRRWWGLIVEENEGFSERKATSTRVLEHVRGTRAEAMARLAELARSHRPQHPAHASRTYLYRTEEGFLLVKEGSLRSYGSRFTVAELLHDSAHSSEAAAAARTADLDPPTPEPPPAEEPGKRSRRRFLRGR